MIKYGYHRTDIKNVASIVEKGFLPGWGAMYGKGWYMCYDLDSQIGKGMEHYGNALIKSKILEKNALVFDYNISKKYFGSKYTINDQLIANHFYRGKEFIPDPWKEISEACELSLIDPRYSATIAYNCFVEDLKGSAVIRQKSLNPSPQSRGDRWGVNSVGLKNDLPRISKLTGIIFSGNHDGNVYVCYDPKSAIPVEYAIVDSTVKSEDEIDWKPVSEFSQDTIKTNKSITEIVYERYPDILNMEIDPGFLKKLNYNIDLLIQQFQWFFKAKKRKARVKINSDGRLSMIGGEWIMGTWEKGHFEGSTWNAGIWKDGVFSNSTWKAGNFLAGYFYNSVFKNGQFKGGRFQDSIFESGSFLTTPFNFDPSSTWKGGKISFDGKTATLPAGKTPLDWAQEVGL